ncbi:MAG: GAF domain-containing protein, partial [Acidobacteriota bacterium]|nr:GAF domain-containing protein [Acidobacteriota bacterium]
MRTHTFAGLLLGLMLCAGPAAAQVPTAPPSSRSQEIGRPLLRTYEPADVGGDGQNWAMVQDRRGVIYAGSSSGVIVFDGVSWRLITTPSHDTVRSLAIDASGRIYAGSVADLGYLQPDAHGTLEFVSLLDKVPAGDRNFGDVWRTFATPDGVYFQAASVIFRWDGQTMHVIRPVSRFNRAALVDNQVYVATPESGLNVVEHDHLRPLPGTEALGHEVFGTVLRYDATRLLIGTRANGLFLYDGHTMTPFPTGVDEIIKGGNLYRAIVLKNGWIALGTTSAGLAIIDHQGWRVAVVDAKHGLPANAVYYLMVDRDGGLWTAGEHGFARIEIPSPMSFFDRSDGYGAPEADLARHDGRLYVASANGVSYLDAAAGRPTRIVSVPELTTQCWVFATVGTALPVACSNGLFEIKGTHAVTIHAGSDGTYAAMTVLASRVDPTRLWVGLVDGLASYRLVGGRWIDEGRIAGTRDQVRSLVENPDGSLWAGTASTGLLRVRFASRPAPGVPRPAASIERFGPAQGLPRGGIQVVSLLGETYFSGFWSTQKIWVAHWDGTGFKDDASLEALPFDFIHFLVGFVDGHDGHAYANLGKGLWMLSRGRDGTWTADRSVFGRFGSALTGPPLVEPDGITWFGTEGRLIRDDRNQPLSGSAPFRTLVRRVTLGGNHTLFAGAGREAAPRLPFSNATFRFEYAAPTFLDESATEYRTRLEGLDRTWSPWTHESQRDYMNLGFGRYRFRVQARNVTGQLGREGDYAFTILPPWYRTWWAYGGYVLLFGLVAFGIDRLQRRRLTKQERERARFTEARLRAEAAEALARAESEGKKSLELLSDIGREITASLDFETIFDKLYRHVNELADADVFGLGLYHADRQTIEYRLAIENGKRYAPYTRDARDPDQLPVWCIEHRQPVFINDLRTEYGRYLKRYDEQRRTLEDGSLSREPQSVIYLPLVAKDAVLGIITIQSFETNAYTTRHLSMMQSLASYVAIALDNAAAYRQLNEQEQRNRQLFEEAERARGVAEEADAAKSAFLSTVSHELRTPLTSVLGFAKIIKKRL